MHYGLLPVRTGHLRDQRAARSGGKIQVGLFNILQKRRPDQSYPIA
jgi:hypothetical protein